MLLLPGKRLTSSPEHIISRQEMIANSNFHHLRDTIRRLLGGHSQTEGGGKYRTEGLIHAVTVWKTSSKASATFAVGYLQSSGG
jgi:hypothetical protein